MRKSKLMLNLIALLAISFVTSTVRADDFKMSGQSNFWEIGIYGGMLFPHDKHEFYEVDYPASGRLSYLKDIAPDFGLRIAYMPLSFLGLEIEGGLMPTKVDDTSKATLLYHARGHLIGQLPYRFTPFLVVGGGLFGSKSDDPNMGNDLDTEFHYGVGFKWYAHENLSLRLDGRHILAPRIEPGGIISHFEALLGISYVFGLKTIPKDTDGDGVIDLKDKCPNEAGKRDDGCPWGDSDGDGITDDKDKCPNEKGIEKYQGCPIPDADSDGINDANDKCPNEKGVKEYQGCPVPDTDGDGIADDKDKCPKVKGEEKYQGCPPPDKDGDGIIDENDKCPEKPETKNGYQDDDGCPDKLPKIIKRFTGAIKGIYFASGKAKIRTKSYPILNKAVKVLSEYKALKLEIRGHTDNRGKHDFNVELSRKRAEAVRDYLIGKGIAGDRLTSKGLGPDEPVADNKTRKGRAKNRRIEFKLIVKE